MPPAKRGSRRPRVAGGGEGQAGDVGWSQRTGMVKDTSGLVPLESSHAIGDLRETEMERPFLMSTPQSVSPSNASNSTPDASRRVTRSTSKGHFDSVLVNSPLAQTPAQNRLRDATIRRAGPATISSQLEDAPDIQYGPAEEDGGEEIAQEPDPGQDQNLPEELPKSHPTVGGLRVPRRSDRIRAKARATRDPSPTTALSTPLGSGNRIQKRRKKHAAKPKPVAGRLRRSARLAKPLDVFHKYPDLPVEIRMMIWEAAIRPRLTYICNRSTIMGHGYKFGIQNKLPSWFMACQLSAHVAKRCYQKLFGHSSLVIVPHLSSPARHQDINPFVDIVVFEPCHSGCRGYYCAQQYSQHDRAAVQKLAVQIDSPQLVATSDPGWVTISRSWPNVETLFMMKPAVRGLDQRDKAMIRIKEGDHEIALRKLFEAWKKGPGQNYKIATLEFVQVVEQEPETKGIKERYLLVEERKTGLPEDIILG
ncbi:hypothetical protein F5Y19DRAFT_318485 [Xylariaceae sp. FL1651]|nr:hypothetical protein F5Y19DRAFT_318485 [Xylariaceae sp. FL1651]